MVLNNIKIRKIEMVCMKCSTVLFRYYVIGNRVRNYTLLKSYRPTIKGNICFLCWKKEQEKEILEEIRTLRKKQDKCTSIKKWNKIAEKITKVLNKNENTY